MYLASECANANDDAVEQFGRNILNLLPNKKTTLSSAVTARLRSVSIRVARRQKEQPTYPG